MKEIKLFTIVNWVFHVSDVLRLFLMSFKYGLISLRYSSTDSVLFLSLLLSIAVTFVFNIIVSPKINYSYWFIIILFFFFMFKKIFLISLYILPLITSISFFNLKRFLISLLVVPSLYVVKKNNYLIKKVNACYTP